MPCSRCCTDQPSHAEEENCVVIRTESSGRWQTRDCSVALPYICKKKELTGYEDIWKYEWMHSLAEGCTFGWMEFHGSCYRLNPRRLTWGEALKTCKKLSGNLVSIHTLEELEFIVHNLKKGEAFSFWGLTQQGSSGALRHLV